MFNINLNIRHRIRTIWQFKFMIPRWSYYFQFIAFILFILFIAFILLCFSICNKFLKSNLYDKFRTNLCGSFILLFSVFMNIVFMLGYVWAIIVQSRFLFYSQLKIHCFYDKFNFMLTILINIFRHIKIEIKCFGISY